MHEAMEPYDFVKAEDYDRQRPERLMPEFMIENEEYILRYIQDKNPEPFMATDYIVCLKGLAKSSRLLRRFIKLREVVYEPVSLDRLPVAMGIDQVDVSDDGIIYTSNVITRLERGYFLHDSEPLYPPDEKFAAAVHRSRASFPGSVDLPGNLN